MAAFTAPAHHPANPNHGYVLPQPPDNTITRIRYLASVSFTKSLHYWNVRAPTGSPMAADDLGDNAYAMDSISILMVVALTDRTVVVLDVHEPATPSNLNAIRDDYCHAFVAHFNVDFTHGLRPLPFVTGPHATPTHWTQTVLCLDRPLPMERGEIVDGMLAR